jgi:cytidylate kinase
MVHDMADNKPSLITISGEPGSGTTTIAKLLSEKTGLRLAYIGETFRQLAKEHGMNLQVFSKYAETHPEIDLELDKRQVQNAQDGNVILEGRLSGWLVKKNGISGFSVLLIAALDTRIKRVMGREDKDYELVRSEILARERCEQERYQKFYNINYLATEHYDLIIDTSELTAVEIVQKIMESMS